MPAFLQVIATVGFYILTGSFFLGYLLLQNGIGGPWPLWWLRIADLPLLCTGLVAGGLGMYRSLTTERSSRALAFGIGIPFAGIFLIVMTLTFLP